MAVASSVVQARRPSAPEATRTQQRERVLVVALSCQVLVVTATIALGLGWRGSLFTAALLQSFLAVALLGVLGQQPGSRVLRIPLVSLCLSLLLVGAAEVQARATGCSGSESGAVSGLAHPAGLGLDFRGTSLHGCSADGVVTELTQGQVRDFYVAELRGRDWRVEAVDETVLVAERAGLRLTVDLQPGDAVDDVTFVHLVVADQAA